MEDSYLKKKNGDIKEKEKEKLIQRMFELAIKSRLMISSYTDGNDIKLKDLCKTLLELGVISEWEYAMATG